MRSPKAKREARQARAAERAADRAALKLEPKLQLRLLEFRGHGHCAEAVRLRERTSP